MEVRMTEMLIIDMYFDNYGVDENTIKGFHVILHANSSSYDINIIRFEDYAIESRFRKCENARVKIMKNVFN